MSTFWHWWIVLLTIACLALVTWILFATRHAQRKDITEETTGHDHDGIEEYDNPLPHWWFLLFVITLVFTAGYLILYPGMGYWAGVFGWTSTGELERTQLKHERRYAPEFARYGATPVEELLNNPRALKMGQRIYLNNCAVCHGTDAGGSFGFPSLLDDNWLYGGTPEAIKTTLLYGRRGAMPAWEAILGEQGVRQVASYTRELSGIDSGASPTDLAAGKTIFQNNCTVCHGADGKGNLTLGAPNLTNNIWLYGSTQARVEYTIRRGRNGVMPPWKDILGEDKVHLVTAYVYSLTHKEPQPEG